MYSDNKFDNFCHNNCGGLETDYTMGALIAHVVGAECPRWGVGNEDKICYSSKCFQKYNWYNGNTNKEKLSIMHAFLLKSVIYERDYVNDGIMDYLHARKEFETQSKDIRCKAAKIVTCFYDESDPSNVIAEESEAEKYWQNKTNDDRATEHMEESLYEILKKDRYFESYDPENVIAYMKEK